MLNKETAEKFAKAIAKDLFTNVQGQHGDRLVMIQMALIHRGVFHSKKDLGGWSEDALASRIKKYLIGEISIDNAGR